MTVQVLYKNYRIIEILRLPPRFPVMLFIMSFCSVRGLPIWYFLNVENESNCRYDELSLVKYDVDT